MSELRQLCIRGVIGRREPERSPEWISELAWDIDRHLSPEELPSPQLLMAMSGLAWAVGRLSAADDADNYAAKVLEQLSSPRRIIAAETSEIA